ncbi:MAG: hypothetical protein IPP69_17210 [Flavobacteriales bacterium]|nr:hypothetical protein [Flavobacteriales bacterium]
MRFDKNTVIGFTLMVVLLIGFAWYQNGEMKKQAEAEQARLDSLAKVEAANPKPSEPAQSIPTSDQAVIVAPAANDSASIASASGLLHEKFGILAAAAQGEKSRHQC